jgi:Helix-turn-helix domain
MAPATANVPRHLQSDVIRVEPNTLIIEDQSLRHGFVQLPKQILYARNLSHVAKLLYAVLLGYAFQEAQCFPGYRRLCEDLQASENMIRKHMRELQAVGLLSQKRRGQGKTNLYILHDLRTAKIEVLEPAKIEVQKPHILRGNNKQKNNKEKKEEQRDVVVAASDAVVTTALANFGISKAAAAKITKQYPVPYIREKLALAQNLVATGSDLVSQNPAGWLRCAIEEDYQPVSHPKRRPKPTARTRKKAPPGRNGARANAEKASVPAVPNHQALPKETHQPAQSVPPEKQQEYKAAWEKTLEQVSTALPVGETAARLTGTALLEVTETVARIGVANPHALAWLERRLYGQITKALTVVIGRAVDLQFVACSH